jgi:type IV pilus assembly protein PilW
MKTTKRSTYEIVQRSRLTQSRADGSPANRSQALSRRRPRGLSLVELLAGLAIGLLVAGAAVTSVMAHLREDRRAADERRLVRELHMAADLVARDLRRAGHWDGVVAASWHEAGPLVVNPHAALTPQAGPADAARYGYAGLAPGAATEDLGLRLSAGVVQLRLGDGAWQALTDAATVQVTHFGLTPTVHPVLLDALCGGACAPGVPGCGAPLQAVRTLVVELRGRSPRAPHATAAAHRVVRVRNDAVTGACPA